MSLIKTAEGWKQLSPKNFVPGTPADQVRADIRQPPYYGPLPSYDCLAFMAKQSADHKEWEARRAARFD